MVKARSSKLCCFLKPGGKSPAIVSFRQQPFGAHLPCAFALPERSLTQEVPKTFSVILCESHTQTQANREHTRSCVPITIVCVASHS